MSSNIENNTIPQDLVKRVHFHGIQWLINSFMEKELKFEWEFLTTKGKQMNVKIKKKRKYQDQIEKFTKKNLQKNFLYVNTTKIVSDE